MENDQYYCMRETWKTHDQEGGSAITMPWEVAQVQNMNHACNQTKAKMKEKKNLQVST